MKVLEMGGGGSSSVNVPNATVYLKMVKMVGIMYTSPQ